MTDATRNFVFLNFVKFLFCMKKTDRQFKVYDSFYRKIFYYMKLTSFNSLSILYFNSVVFFKLLSGATTMPIGPN